MPPSKPVEMVSLSHDVALSPLPSRRASQDRLAFEKLRTRGALPAVCNGDLAETAFALLRNEWTSLPGAKQTRMTMEEGKSALVGYGGTAK